MKDSTISRLSSGAARVRRGALWMIFALVLLIPKVNRLRRRRTLWNSVRVVMAVVGAAILAIALKRRDSATPLASGALMLLFALFSRPERAGLSVDARARELGALIVVDAGLYIDPAGSPRRAKLFIAPDRVLVLDAALRVLLELPSHEVRTLLVQPAGANWSLRVDGDRTAAEFIYEGTFAEHLARVAEATLRSRLYRELPILR
jgi:hypothetical protein